MPAKTIQEKAEARRKNIYIYLARQVGRTSSGNRNLHLCKKIISYCVYGGSRATVVDGYHVWCEVMDISPASDDSLGSLFGTDNPDPDETLRTMYTDYVQIAHKAKQSADDYANKRDQEDLRELINGEE